MDMILSRGKINAKSGHSSDMTMDYFSKLSKSTIERLFEVYQHDFALGGYEYPKRYINVGVNIPNNIDGVQMLGQ